MEELENLAQWRRFAAVMQIEWKDQAEMSGCLDGGLWAQRAVRLRKVAVLAEVMYWGWVGQSGMGRIPRGSPEVLCRRRVRQTMRRAAAIGQRSGLVVPQKKGIFSPFCLFFCVLQRMQTEEMLDNCELGGDVVDDDFGIFEGVDADSVTSPCLGHAGLNVVRPLQVPPEV